MTYFFQKKMPLLEYWVFAILSQDELRMQEEVHMCQTLNISSHICLSYIYRTSYYCKNNAGERITCSVDQSIEDIDEEVRTRPIPTLYGR